MRSTIKLILCKLCNATHFVVEGHYIIYTIIGHCLSLSLSVALIFGLYRPSSGPIALRNDLKCSA